MGLAWALQRGGARSVVACGWRVDDETTAMLMAQFASNLGRMDHAEALRRAQLAVLQRAPHPYYWAAPVLLGRTDALGLITPAPAPPGGVSARFGVAFLIAIAAAIRWALARRRARASDLGAVISGAE